MGRALGSPPAEVPLTRDVLSLLDADPDLGEALSREEFEQARRELAVRRVRVPAGRWDPEATWNGFSTPALGLLLIDGLVLRDMDLGRRSTTEVLGAGDLLRPWDGNMALEALPLQARWTVMEEVSMAVLDHRFLLCASRWPAVVDAVCGRMARRSRWLAVRLVVNQLVRLEDRLLLALWALAERWGRVTPHGVLIPLGLTHSTLARLVGARRPSVTSALGLLHRDGQVRRTEHGWLLLGDPSHLLEPVTERLAAS